jgi:hypothetical protein
MWGRRNCTANEIADIIDRFLSNKMTNPFEWDDFIESGVKDPKLNEIRKQCEKINVEFYPDRNLSKEVKLQHERAAEERLRSIATQLRNMDRKTEN